jgi:hemolysin activation/secretion protein
MKARIKFLAPIGAWLMFISPFALTATHDIDPDTSAMQRDFPEYAPDRPPPITTPPAAPPAHIASATAKLQVKSVEFKGGSVFSAAQLQAIAAPFLNRPLDSADIEELRYRLTRLYVDQGYINSGALLDHYDANTQHLRFRLQEGELREVHVKTTGQLRPDYVADRLRLSGAAPFHLPTLQERFLVLLDDPLIDSLHGGIAPSSEPGEAILEAEASGKRPYSLSLTLDNHGPVSLGEKRALLSSTLRNLSGFGELLTLGFDASDGNRRGRADVSIPLNAYDTRFHAFYEHSNVVVVEEPVDLLDVKGDYTAYEFGLIHPLIQSVQRGLTLGLSMGRRSNKTRLLDMPFSFTQGVVNGRSTLAPLRFSQEWTERGTQQVYTLRSVLSLGLDALGATHVEKGPVDSRFAAWLLQQRYAQQMWNRRLQFIGRLDAQIVDSPLPALEQVSVGGADSVRGYRENVLIRDQVVLGSLELRYALLDSALQSRYGRLEGALFTDFAQGWNKGSHGEKDSIYSVGLGLVWSWQESLQAQLYWGHPLKDPPHEASGTLQDEGIHFRLQATY